MKHWPLGGKAIVNSSFRAEPLVDPGCVDEVSHALDLCAAETKYSFRILETTFECVKYAV